MCLVDYQVTRMSTNQLGMKLLKYIPASGDSNTRTHQAFDHFCGVYDLQHYSRPEGRAVRQVFFNMLSDAMTNNIPYCITEDISDLPTGFQTCYRIDLDLNLYTSEATALNVHVQQLVDTLYDILYEYTNVSIEDGTMIVLLQKPQPTLKQKQGTIMYKHGAKLCFPHLTTTQTEMRQLRTLLYQRFEQWGSSEWLQGTDVFQSQIIDDSVYKSNGWCIYGSQKLEQTAGAYQPVKVWKNKHVTEAYADLSLTLVETQHLLSIYPDPEDCKVVQLAWIEQPPAQSVYTLKRKSKSVTRSDAGIVSAKRLCVKADSSSALNIMQSILEQGVNDTTSVVCEATRTQYRPDIISYRFKRTCSSPCAHGESHSSNGGYLHLNSEGHMPVVKYVCESSRCPDRPKHLSNATCHALAQQWAEAEGVSCDDDLDSLCSTASEVGHLRG